MPQCPSCGEELDYHDYFGNWSGGRIVNNKGHIYKCPNGSSDDEELQENAIHRLTTPLAVGMNTNQMGSFAPGIRVEFG